MKKETRGRIVYVPASTLNEVKIIQKELDIKSRPEAFRKLSSFSRIGREKSSNVIDLPKDWEKIKKKEIRFFGK